MSIEIQGTVVTGKGEAKKLGYPTANIAYTSEQMIEPGVWTCFARFGSTTKPGLAVVGMWQQADASPSVEVHVIDFAGDLYGQEMTVGLQEKLRDLKSFSSVEALIHAIEEDIREAKKRFI